MNEPVLKVGDVVRLRHEYARWQLPRFQGDLFVKKVESRYVWSSNGGRYKISYKLGRHTKSGREENFHSCVGFDKLFPADFKNKTLGDYL